MLQNTAEALNTTQAMDSRGAGRFPRWLLRINFDHGRLVRACAPVGYTLVVLGSKSHPGKKPSLRND
jgi:hypothetical protein